MDSDDEDIATAMAGAPPDISSSQSISASIPLSRHALLSQDPRLSLSGSRLGDLGGGLSGVAGSDFEELKKDQKYKRYIYAVDKVLQSFEAVNEWADVIGFLTRLLKTLQAYPQYPNVPRKLIVAKRLAQCLNPALPSGVHLKCLEVYSCIFETSGHAQLAEDLPLWSLGLFPFLNAAATSVK
ncbi:hypothetical protein HDV05_001124, partial [Chytridiales sp. JEL 0842]